MKAVLTCIVLTAIVISCNRPSTSLPSSALLGNWKMITVHNLTTNATIINDDQGEVRMQITARNGSPTLMTGTTPYNSFSSAIIPAGDSNLSFKDFGCTKVYDRPWGRVFLDNMPQAVQYSLTGSTLTIKTRNQVLLSFVRD